jgi:hypothetical protein
MKRAAAHHYSIGWDVGAWHCDTNSNSRDAIAILDSQAAIVGTRWRGNLRRAIEESATSGAFVAALFSLCGAGSPAGEDWTATMAIDAPLGFSEAFQALVAGRGCVEPGGRRPDNPYLFRRTERHHFERGAKPLSAVQDMLGSQATKAMHALRKFTPTVLNCGVWTDGRRLTALETYPSVCDAAEFARWRDELCGLEEKGDRRDALTCALVAHLFAADRGALEPPELGVPCSEGWIWYPRSRDDRATGGNPG